MALDLLADDSITNRSWPNVAEDVRNVTFYVMGADEVGARGGYWTTLDDFPEPTPTRFYLGADGGLTPAPPSGAAAGTRSYVYEPSNPVITIGGNNLEIKCGPLDQRPIEKAARQDVLLFTTAPLSAPLAITGGVDATIFVSTNVLDTDVVVKLIDVYPAIDPADPFLSGESVLVQDGISRLKWRNWRTDTAEALLSGDPAEVYTTTVSLWNTSYVFAAGHRIRVHVTSSNFPRFYPNPNTGSSFDSRNVTAATTIHFDGAKASSYLTLPVVPLSALPPFPIEEALAAAAERHGDKWRALMSAGGGDGETDLTAWLSKRAETAVTSSRKRMEL
jgi:putative CocE/NonD family hydrolase